MGLIVPLRMGWQQQFAGYHRSKSYNKNTRVCMEKGLNDHLTCDSSPWKGTNECSKETVCERDTAHTARNVEARPGDNSNQAKNRQSHPSRSLIL